MTKSQLRLHLEKVKAYLDGLGIPAAINNKEVAFQIGGKTYRATSVYSAKRLVRMVERRVSQA